MNGLFDEHEQTPDIDPFPIRITKSADAAGQLARLRRQKSNLSRLIRFVVLVTDWNSARHFVRNASIRKHSSKCTQDYDTSDIHARLNFWFTLHDRFLITLLPDACKIKTM